MAYYITYSLEGHHITQNHSVTLKLYSDDNGTPLETGELLGTYTGAGDGMTVGTDGTAQARDWIDTLVSDGGGTSLDVSVSDAGTGVALISFEYDGETRFFDASALRFGSDDAEADQNVYGSESAVCAETGRRPPIADIPVYGNIEIHATPTADNHAITKRYLEEHSGDFAGETKEFAGDGITKNFTLAHTLGTRDVHVTVYDESGAQCVVRTVIQSETMILLTFAEAPSAGSAFRILISR